MGVLQYFTGPHLGNLKTTLLLKMTALSRGPKIFLLEIKYKKFLFQDKCREKFGEKNWTWRDEIRMLFRGVEITGDKNLMDITGLDNNSELQLVCSVPPTRPLINEVRVQGRNMPGTDFK